MDVSCLEARREEVTLGRGTGRLSSARVSDTWVLADPGETAPSRACQLLELLKGLTGL